MSIKRTYTNDTRSAQVNNVITMVLGTLMFGLSLFGVIGMIVTQYWVTIPFAALTTIGGAAVLAMGISDFLGRDVLGWVRRLATVTKFGRRSTHL